MFHDDFWKPFILRSKCQWSGSRDTKTLPAWVFALLWVLVSSSLPRCLHVKEFRKSPDVMDKSTEADFWLTVQRMTRFLVIRCTVQSRGVRRSVDLCVRGGVKTISLTPPPLSLVMWCWSFCPALRNTFSYLKLTKIQDFNQTFSGDVTPGPPQLEGAFWHSNIFDAMPPLGYPINIFRRSVGNTGWNIYTWELKISNSLPKMTDEANVFNTYNER